MKTYLLFFLLSALFCFNLEAEAALLTKPRTRILVSVGDLKNNTSSTWKKSTCFQIYTLGNQVIDQGVDIVCREFNTDNFLDKDLQSKEEKFDYHLRVLKTPEDVISVDVTKWHRKHQSDFQTLGWNFQDAKNSKVTKEQALSRAVANFFFYAANEDAYKAGLLAQGAFESERIEFNESQGIFIDKMTNERISINRAIMLYEDESPRKKNYLRTGIEVGVQLSAAMAIYYKNLVFNQVDFDYSLKSGLKGKFVTGEAIKFDDNDKMSNYGHIYAGVMYYQTARSNGFTSLESALITFASSAAWEILEYHEVFSVNDQILTPVGGYVIGEATYQIACALVTKNSIGAKVLGYTLNPNLGLNHALDKGFKGNKYAAQPDCKKPRWSDISVYVGLDKGQKAYEPSKNNDYVLGMNATVVNIDGYTKEGKEAKMVYDTSMSKMLIELNGNQGLIDLKVVAQVVMASYYKKDISSDERGRMRGYQVSLGVGSASTWTDRGNKELTKEEDFYGTINILGATAHANILYKGFNIKADFGIYGDFAMVKSYSAELTRDSRGGDKSGESSIMQRKGYYFGAGASTIAAISISQGPVEVGYQAQFSSAKSINTRNRVEGTNGDVYRDKLYHNKFYITYTLTKNLKLQLSQEYNVRMGSTNKTTKKDGVEKRSMGTLVYQF